MFKEKFNSLAVSIEKFALKESTKPTFEKVSDQITYYRDIVDEYYYIKTNLQRVLDGLDNNNQVLIQEVNDSLNGLEELFNPYKSEFIVSSYMKEIEAFDEKTDFYERLFKFENMLVEQPLKKIEEEVLQDILTYVKKYSAVTDKYYFFANNPFNIDDDLGIVIPQRYDYDSADKLINGVYNYMYGIYNTYKGENADTLSQLDVIENAIQEKIYQFAEDLRQAKKNRYYADYETMPSEYYDTVMEIRSGFDNKLSNIIETGVYRFYSLSKRFKEFEVQYNKFIGEYLENDLYVACIENKDFNNDLDKLQEFVYLLEEGKINEDKEYILTDINLKDLVEKLIIVARDKKKKIFYTQKYHETGIPTKLEYEFYQTEQFLNGIKRYYYELMTENIYRHTKLSIDDFGDGTVNEYRIIYKSQLAKYEQFLGQENDFMNDFEVQEYVVELETIQDKLKVSAMNFFDVANKTSPLTFEETIEKMYRNLLDRLKTDLEYIKNKVGMDIIKVNVDPNREIALSKLRDISKHITKLEYILYLSRKYVYLDMTDFIETNIYTPYNDFYVVIKEAFNREQYIKVIVDYDNFYKDFIFDFNMLFSLEKLADSTEKIFTKMELLSNTYIDEQITEEPSFKNKEELDFVMDMFDDETYKVVRNEIFSQLDIYYEFVISMRPNEKPFLINEKNLKKVYFDNQLMKLNYIRLYHIVITERSRYVELKEDAEGYSWFESIGNDIERFDYKSRLETLILNQNRVLSEITKMIIEYGSDNNYNTIDVSSESVMSIESYNSMSGTDISEYVNNVNILKGYLDHEKLQERYQILLGEHRTAWNDLINKNEIPETEEVSYLEMEPFKGNIPFMVELEAKKEIVSVGDDETEEPEFTWDFGNGLVKKGEKVSHTFYEEGKHKVKCDMTFPSGATSTRYVEFDLEGATNSQSVKSEEITYAPIEKLSGMSKISYFDEEAGEQVTVPINITLNPGEGIVDAIGNGSISVSESDSELVATRTGLVILGFEGVEFPGQAFDNDSIFSEDFEMPEEAEFLFDFRVSDPIVNKSVLDFSDSKFVESFAKLPSNINSVYEIDSAAKYQPMSGNTMAIIPGDILMMRNIMGRYAIIEVKKISENVDADAGKYGFELVFDVNVNVSLNRYDRDVFKPMETSLVVPTLVFKTEVRELFSALIGRLEEIDSLKDELRSTVDNERVLTIQNKIETLEYENSKYYLFEEYNKLNAKVVSLESLRETLWTKCSLENGEDCINNIIEINKTLEAQLNQTKTFEQYMKTINVYEFKKNIVDLTTLIELYNDQILTMKILMDTYNYRKYDSYDYFKEKLNELKYFPKNCKIDLENYDKPYEKKLALLVEKLRDYIFKLKLIINYPILSEGKHILFSQIYTRPERNEETGEYTEQKEDDFYLLNKKLEMIYGYEAEKVEIGANYTDLVGDLISMKKELFGNGLSEEDLDNLGNYVQVVESRTIEEYDDFFMIPFWIDYLRKS